MMNIHVNVFLMCSVFVLSTGSSLRNLPTVSFEEGYAQIFGDDNLVILRDGKSAHLTLNERTGSGFVSHDLYNHGFFSASIKLPADYTAGVVVAFYMSTRSHSNLFLYQLPVFHSICRAPVATATARTRPSA